MSCVVSKSCFNVFRYNSSCTPWVQFDLYPMRFCARAIVKSVFQKEYRGGSWMEFDARLHLKRKSACVRRGVCACVHHLVFTVAILAQGTNRGDALCAALLLNRVGTILSHDTFLFCFWGSTFSFVQGLRRAHCPE